MTTMSPSARGLSLRAHLGPNKHADALATLCWALFTDEPFVAGVEPSATGAYGRVATANSGALFPAIPLGTTQVAIQADVVFPTATGPYSTGTTPLLYWGILDTSTLGAGTLWYGGRLAAQVLVAGAGDQPRLLSGAVTFFQGG